jgi:glycosyltransferase involved in cell wall biosynthesis
VRPLPEAAMNNQPTISLCMIVKNEAENIRLCLDSVKNVVDEIIIVDTGSTDKTVEICREYTDKIYFFQWCDDFSAARNESIKHATKDWILILDADELLAPISALNIKSLLQSTPVENEVITPLNYEIPKAKVIEYLQTKSNIPFSLYKPGHRPVRIFRNHQGLRFTYRLHEIIDGTQFGLHKTIFQKIYLIHHGYDKSPTLTTATQKNRQERNLACLYRDLAEHPDDFIIRFNIARELFSLTDDRWMTMMDELIADILAQKKGDNTYSLRQIYRFYIPFLLEAKKHTKALDITYDWIKRLQDNYDLTPYMYLGNIYLKLDRETDAQKTYELVLQMLAKNIPLPYPEELPLIERTIYHHLGVMYACQGNYPEAEKLLLLLKTKQLLPPDEVTELLAKAKIAAG